MLTKSRAHTPGTLGNAITHQPRKMELGREKARRRRHPIRQHGILPPNVSLEQRHVLQAPCPERDAILLARRAQRALLLRRRLRRLRLHARQQQDVRLHHQPVRRARIHPLAVARDGQVPCQPPRLHPRAECHGLAHGYEIETRTYG